MRHGRLRAILPLLICIPLLAFRVQLLLTPLPLLDFMTYWAAGHMFLSGGDPYSMGGTYAIYRSFGWPYVQQFVMTAPPWAMPLVALFALLPFHVAHSSWFAASLILEGTSSVALWRYFGGEKRQQWMALLVLATFLPAAAAEHYGQITPLILVGITGFLFALRRKQYVLAGVFLFLFSLKPHLLYLVLLAILLWSIQNKKWFVPITASLMVAGTLLGAIAFNRNVLVYFHGTVHAAMDMKCGVGGALRSVFGEQHEWLQFLPCVPGCIWFAFYWTRYRRCWKWEERLPLLLLVSIASAPYFWVHDFVLGIPALIALGVQVERVKAWHIAAVLYLVVQELILAGGALRAASVASLLWIVLYFVILRLCPIGEGATIEPSPAVG